MWYHLVAILSGGRTKTVNNKEETEILQSYVIPFLQNGVLEESWGKKKFNYQALELRIYKTNECYSKKNGINFDKFIHGKSNVFKRFEIKAKSIINKKVNKVFVVTPIQGKESGSQEDQRIYKEYNARFEKLESLLRDYGCTAIRIDKEFTIKNLAERIRKEIQKSTFVIADLTDERPSCYYEVGYAEALKKAIIYVASEYSVIDTKQKTKIHFDIHNNVNHFTNLRELEQKIRSTLDKNRGLFLIDP